MIEGYEKKQSHQIKKGNIVESNLRKVIFQLNLIPILKASRNLPFLEINEIVQALSKHRNRILPKYSE